MTASDELVTAAAGDIRGATMKPVALDLIVFASHAGSNAGTACRSLPATKSGPGLS
jgi:hypothetical protein